MKEIDFSKPIEELKNDLDNILVGVYNNYFENCHDSSSLVSIALDKYIEEKTSRNYIRKPELDKDGFIYLFNINARTLLEIKEVSYHKNIVNKYIIDNNELENYIYRVVGK